MGERWKNCIYISSHLIQPLIIFWSALFPPIFYMPIGNSSSQPKYLLTAFCVPGTVLIIFFYLDHNSRSIPSFPSLLMPELLPWNRDTLSSSHSIFGILTFRDRGLLAHQGWNPSEAPKSQWESLRD